MKKFLSTFLVVFYCHILFSQSYTYNVKEYGAVGNGINDDSKAINNLIKKVASNIIKNSEKYTLYFPEGTYLLNNPLIVPELLDIRGENNHRSIIKVNGKTNGAIIRESNKSFEALKGKYYNWISDLVIQGPDYNQNPFAWKNTKNNNPNSVGIKLSSSRNRINNCIIDGFNWAGIETSGSYYNFITECFIKNNRVGVLINNTSTSAYINNNEFRINSIGIYIANSSFGNFINNNMIESNISNFLDKDRNEFESNILKRGKGILIENSKNNLVNNNYFEQHYVNIALSNANNNSINDNYFAIGDLTPHENSDQVLIKFFTHCEKNNFLDNKLLTPSKRISPFNIIVNEIDKDYSSNIIYFNKTDNNILRGSLIKKYGNTIITIDR